MAPTVAVEVPPLSFNELIGQLVAAHDREIVDLQTEIKQLRDSKDDASTGEISASGSGSGPLELSTFSSRQPALAGTEEYEPLPEDTEACLPPQENSEELPRPPCLTQQHQVRPDAARKSSRKRSGPDAKALACALQVAQNLGAISEDHVHGFEMEADLLFSESATSSHEEDPITPEVSAGAPGRPETEASPDSGGALAPTRSKHSHRATEPPSSLVRSEVVPIKKSCLPASPLDDYEFIPEEDKSCVQRGSINIDVQVEASSIKTSMDTNCHGSSSSATASTDDQPKSPESLPDGKVLFAPREWSIFSELTGEAVSTVNRTLETGLGLTSGLGLHTSAIWIEASDHGRHRRPSARSRSDTDSSAPPWNQPCRMTDFHEGGLNDSSHLEVSRQDNRGLEEDEDLTVQGIELSKLDEIEINRDSELGAHEAGLLDMSCEKYSGMPALRERKHYWYADQR